MKSTLYTNGASRGKLEPVQLETADILFRLMSKRRHALLMELAEIEDLLQLPRTKPARRR